jgi:undecaprenyl-phosphate 4-deoxy-4-formamido-L-arabinose transferase
VIPVYNSTATLRPLVERLIAVLEELNHSFEIVCVDDGSRDGSWDVMCQLQREHPDQIVVIQLMRNFGQHNALMCGFRHTQGRLVVTIDDDLQHPPEELPKLLAAIESGNFDLVYANPGRRRHHAWRNLGSWLVNTAYRTMFRTKVTISSFRIMRRELLDAIFAYTLNYTFVDGLLAWNTQRIGEVTVEHHPRTTGRTGYSLSKLVVLALNLFTNFSLLPLQAVTLVGFAAAASGLVAGGYYVVRYFQDSIGVPGYASVIVSILVLGGVQLLSLGIIGEYLGRLHLNVNRKPQYTIRAASGTGTPADMALVEESCGRRLVE